MKRMSTAEMAWTAGIVEGEGWFVASQQSNMTTLNVAMTDFDVIERLYEITGVGRLQGPRATKTGSKLQLTWVVNKRPEVADIIYAILPYLGERRSMQALRVLDVIDELDRQADHRNHFFSCGHPATPENTYVIGRDSRPGPSRACRECSLEKSVARNKQRSAAKQAARIDSCAWDGCGNSMAGRHMNARYCSEDCASAAVFERRRRQSQAVR